MDAEKKSALEGLGVDFVPTMERFVDNEGLYLKCLDKLLADKNYGMLLEAIRDGDVNAAFEASHALKGVSANLGLDRLYRELKIIVEVFRSGSLDYDPENFERLKAVYEETTATIKEVLK